MSAITRLCERAGSLLRLQGAGTLRTILLTVVLLVNALVLVLLWHALNDSRAQREHEVSTTLENLSVLLDQNLAASTQRVDLLLQDLADRLELTLRMHPALDGAAVNAWLAASETRLGDIGQFRVTDAAGVVRFGPGVSPGAHYSYADRDFFVAHRDHPDLGLRVRRPVVGRISGIWVIPFTRSYRDAGGHFAGIVSAAIPVSYFARLLSGLDLGPHGIALLRDADTGLIARYPPVAAASQRVGTRIFSPELAQIIASGVNSKTYHPIQTGDGIERTNTYRRLSSPPFHLIAGMAPEDYLDEWRNEVRKAVLFGVLFLVVTTLSAWLLWRSFSRAEKASLRTRILLQNASDGIHILDANGNVLEASRAFCRMLGCSRAEVLRMNVRDWDVEIPPDQLLPAIARQLGSDEISTFETMHRRKDGSRFAVEVTGYAVELDGRMVLYNASRDITARRRAQAELRLLASVFRSSYEGIMIADADQVIVDVNAAFTRITGYAREEVIGHSPSMLTSGRHDADFYQEMWRVLQRDDLWRGEIWNRRKNGEVYAEMLAISAVRDPQGQLQHFIGVFTDISQIKQHEQELDRIAHYDLLTGAPNRRLLADRLGQAVARARRHGNSLAVCYLDLDGFKAINDRYGHAAGDLLLVTIAERLKRILRNDDTLARLGGDEFVLLFSDLGQSLDIHGVLERVLGAVSLPVRLNDSMVSISASIGAALYPADDVDPDALLRHADQAMYLAKEAGKNRYHLFDADHHRQLQLHRFHRQRLDEAMQHGEFVLHYQPKVDLLTGEVVGAEALIRWRHPEQGLLLPAQFLHYINGSDLEVPLGEWVIDRVLEQIGAWHARGLTLTVSANISATHLLQANFAQRLGAALARHPIPAPGLLELEILETAAVADMEQAVITLTECRQFGVRFALDDFGTGYSSLTYLRKLPVHMLKIDQSFVRHMLDDPDDLVIVEGVVRLAHAFNRPVIAEGAATLAHGAVLLQLGCRLAQGFGIAGAMPPGDLPGWVAEWRRAGTWRAFGQGAGVGGDVTLMVATNCLRSWCETLVGALANPATEVITDPDSESCRFGRWYRNGGAARFGDLELFRAIDPLHARLHQLAAEMLALARSAEVDAAQQRLPGFLRLRDELIELLAALS